MTEPKPRLAELVHYFIDADRMHRTLVEERIGTLNLHRSQHMMLRCIERCDEPPTQRYLAQMLGISTATVAVTAKKLEAEGYISRIESESDSRCNQLYLTEKGKDILLRARDIFDTVDNGMFADLSDEELLQFAATLKKIQNNLVKMGAQCPGAACFAEKDDSAKQ